MSKNIIILFKSFLIAYFITGLIIGFLVLVFGIGLGYTITLFKTWISMVILYGTMSTVLLFINKEKYFKL